MNFQNLTVPEILRRVGALILVAAGATFMIEGWQNLTSIGKYLSFLGFTFVLAVLGVITAKRWGDSKGARTFLGLATATLPVHFSQLGAMLYATFIGTRSDLPSWFRFSSTDPITLLFVTALGILCVVPIARIGFSAFVRDKANPLTFYYLVGNLILLIPVRTGAVVVAGVALIAHAFFYNDKKLSLDIRMRTWEGELCRLLLIAPIAVLVGRTLLYPQTGFSDGLLLTVIGSALYFSLARSISQRTLAALFEMAGLIFYVSAWFNIVTECCRLFYWDGFVKDLVTFVPVGFLMFGISLFAKYNGRAYRILASFYAILSSLIFLLVYYKEGSSLVTLSVGVLYLMLGVVLKERTPAGTGLLLVAAGLVTYLNSVFEIFFKAPWISLAILGTVTLLMASLIERKSDSVKLRIQRAKDHIAAWR